MQIDFVASACCSAADVAELRTSMDSMGLSESKIMGKVTKLPFQLLSMSPVHGWPYQEESLWGSSHSADFAVNLMTCYPLSFCLNHWAETYV